MLKIILFINIIIVNINIYFKYFSSLSISYFVTEKNLSIKNIDKMIINFFKNSYKNISFLLNSKYIVNNSNILNKKKKIKKKKISIYLVDFHPSFYFKPQYELLKKILKKKYELEIKSNNPDYLIFDVFGCNNLNEAFQKSITICNSIYSQRNFCT